MVNLELVSFRARRGAFRAMICLGVLVASTAGCGGNKPVAPAASIDAAPETSVTVADSSPASSSAAATTPVRQVAAVDPVVVIHTSVGDLKLQLYPQKAPRTVDNFLRNYVNRSFYEGTIFHHVEKGSLIAAGGYTPDLQPKPTRAPIFNEASNGLKNKRGAIALARDPASAHSGTSQFFLNIADNEGLDYISDETDADFGYCVFGQVVEGLELLDKMSELPVAAQGDFPAVPEQPVTILSIEQIK